MTDQELIDLVQEKTPEELSLAEIDALRSRIGESPQLRDVVLGEIELNQSLSQTLGRFQVSIDRIVQGTSGGGPGSVPAVDPISPLVGWTVGTIVAGILGSVLVIALVVPPPAMVRPKSGSL